MHYLLGSLAILLMVAFMNSPFGDMVRIATGLN